VLETWGAVSQLTDDVMDTFSMPFTEVSMFEERLEFVRAYEAGAESMSEPCRRFGINRKTGYKWADRYILV